MTSIWGFILQTIEVSLIALLILVLKRIFKDKLSPRWQYGIWVLLLISLLKPIGYIDSYVIPYIQVYIEAFKSYIESFIQSSYSSSFLITYNTSFIPYIKSIPHSITDILFVLYVIGVYATIIKYFIDYFKLKSILKLGEQPDEDVINKINDISHRYHLHTCKVVVIEGLSSAFVCGILKPILVLPHENVDDKVILHELLHLKNKDLLHNVIWSLFKAIHFCNPFMIYVFQIIHNDMETLCDYRVLELLDGEERREYGRILLSMINEKYPYAFGTTSLSNGAKFIKERIETIARFKKYPKGVSLVSICIVILIIPMILNNNGSTQYISGNQFENKNSFSYHLSISSAKLVKCNTIAGAIDTYAKGLYSCNDLYLISVMPQEILNNNMQDVLKNKPKGMISSGVSHTLGNSAYEVYNLVEVSHNKYNAVLLFGNHYNENRYDENNEKAYVSEIWTIPIEITKEYGWKVKQIDNMKYDKFDRELGEYISSLETTYNEPIHKFTYNNKYGDLSLNMINRVFVDDNYQSNIISDIFNNTCSYSLVPDPNAKFAQMDILFTGNYVYNEEYKPNHEIGIATARIKNLNNDADFSFIPDLPGAISGSDGTSASVKEIWRLQNRNMPIHERTWLNEYNIDNFNRDSYAQIHIYHDNEIVMDLKLNLKVGEIYD